MRDQVLAQVSHDLKNPLTRVSLHAQMADLRLQEVLPEVPEPVTRELQGVRDDVNRMTELIDELLEVGQNNRAAQVAEAAPKIGGDEIENPLGGGSEAADGEVAAQHDDGHIDAAEQIGEIVVHLRHFRVAVLQFLVERRQFLIGRLQLLFGGLKFLIGALQFLVAGLDFFIGGLEFLIGGLLFGNDRLK